jgi:LPXTG-motif cell wall-anchored protein
VRGRTLAISAYLFLAALAVPAVVGAQAPIPSPATGQPTPPTTDQPRGDDPLPQQSAPTPDPGAPAPSATYVRKDDGKGGNGNPRANAAASTAVTIVDFKFKPDPIKIGVGDTITWTNEDSAPHTATANNGSFDTHTLKKGQSGSHKFTQNATVRYTCIIHPNMKGTVIVGNGGSGGGGSGGGGGRSSGTSSSGSIGGSSFGTGTGGSTGTSGTSSSLPNTGQNELPLIVGGAVLLTLGLLLRRWVWARI